MGFLAGVEVGALKTVKGNKNSYSIDICKLTVKIKAFLMFIQITFFQMFRLH